MELACGRLSRTSRRQEQVACVDGPSFEAHEVNFEVLVQRNAMYRDAERRSLEEYRHAKRSANNWRDR
jgi:flagellar basal body rod protein FlgB